MFGFIIGAYLERAMGFEPTTPTLARLCSTPELHPHPQKEVTAQAAERPKPPALVCQNAAALATDSPTGLGGGAAAKVFIG